MAYIYPPNIDGQGFSYKTVGECIRNGEQNVEGYVDEWAKNLITNTGNPPSPMAGSDYALLNSLLQTNHQSRADRGCITRITDPTSWEDYVQLKLEFNNAKPNTNYTVYILCIQPSKENFPGGAVTSITCIIDKDFIKTDLPITIQIPDSLSSKNRLVFLPVFVEKGSGPDSYNFADTFLGAGCIATFQ